MAWSLPFLTTRDKELVSAVEATVDPGVQNRDLRTRGTSLYQLYHGFSLPVTLPQPDFTSQNKRRECLHIAGIEKRASLFLPQHRTPTKIVPAISLCLG